MPTEIKNKVIQADSLVDEAFDAAKTISFQLILQISVDGVLVAVNEKTENKFIAFENFTFQNNYNFNVMGDLLEEVIRKSKLIKHKYRSVSCVVMNNLSTLIPVPLFDDDRKKMFLKFNTSLEGDELVLADEIKSLDAKNVFALPFSIKSKLDQLFNNINYHHASSCLIDSLLTENKNQTTKKLFVHIQASHFEAVVIEGKKMLFYNTFNHHSAEDLIYYLLFVCEQLHLNPENIEVVLLGEIEKNSAIYVLTQKYIRNLKFGERTDRADYSYQLQALPKHSYFTLFNSYLA